jgi:Protein of unknown function (DUF2442)
MQINKISSVKPIMNGVLLLTFQDGFEGLVDMRPKIALGGTWAFLKNNSAFIKASIREDKRVIEWHDAEHYADACADALREKAEKVEQVLKLVG